MLCTYSCISRARLLLMLLNTINKCWNEQAHIFWFTLSLSINLQQQGPRTSRKGVIKQTRPHTNRDGSVLRISAVVSNGLIYIILKVKGTISAGFCCFIGKTVPKLWLITIALTQSPKRTILREFLGRGSKLLFVFCDFRIEDMKTSLKWNIVGSTPSSCFRSLVQWILHNWTTISKFPLMQMWLLDFQNVAKNRGDSPFT